MESTALRKPIMEGEIVETAQFRFTMRPDGILFSEGAPGFNMTLEDAQECTRITNELQGFQAKPLMCDLTNIASMTYECRKHFSGDVHAETYTKCALIIGNPVSRILGNFFIGLNRPKKPVRLFTSQEKAVAWLKSN